MKITYSLDPKETVRLCQDWQVCSNLCWMKKLLKDIGHRVRKTREDLDLTQEQLAERAGLHVSYVGQIERGLREPSLKSLVSVSKALNMGVDELLMQERLQDGVDREISRLLREQQPEQSRLLLRILRTIIKYSNK